MSAFLRLSGKVALITGGAQGIGEAISRKLIEHGAKVLIGDIQQEKGAALAASLGDAASFVTLDVTDPDGWSAAIARAAGLHDGLDVLVNNAGNGTGGPIENHDVANHKAIVDLN